MARFYLDQHIDAEVAVRLRADGHDVLTSLQATMDRASDEEQLAYASVDNRILLTHNIRDFLPLSQEWARQGRIHAGLIYSSFQPPALICQRLVKLLDLYSDGLAGQTIALNAWLDDVAT